MAIAKFAADVYDFDSAMTFLNGKSQRKLAGNTYAYRHDVTGTIVVEYHGNLIARFYPDGTKIYTNAGYGTMTTRGRLTKLSRDLDFIQRDFEQLVVCRRTGVTHDLGAGVTVNGQGVLRPGLHAPSLV